ncbi:glutathione S-transferase family protein [Duganella sp. FT3S]|uniref:Glutathione S-transferase family protein n=1 Tax=Rugamonas fusca TaxID=2758568 RepID=A0A7W2I8Z8_9BURK|nr:glutathione S-transferase family protein [Rugamonas fusca]MBA5608074.1 glutathione S-transferase family protein [Rugamonas fusca]
MSLTLYYHPLASYCHKVLIALYENGTPFEKRLIDLGKEDDRAALAAVWPPVRFPVLRDHARGRDVPESTIIIEYLDHHYRGHRPLIPADWNDALDVRLWERFFDGYVQDPMQRIVADRLYNTKADMASQRAMLTTAYGMLEQQLGERNWVAGSGFSMADCAAAPALFYASTLVPIPAGHHHLHAYFTRLMDRPSARRVLEEAKPYFQFYPFEEAIPQRFR